MCSPIYRFKVSSIVEADNDDKFKAEWATKGKYYIISSQYFDVFANQRQVIGVDDKKKNTLKTEELSGNRESSIYSAFGRNKKTINSVLLAEALGLVFAGDNSGEVLQYDIKQGRSQYKLLRRYDQMQIGNILSFARFGTLLAVGGDKGKCRFIDLKTKSLIPLVLETCVRSIYSIKFCRVSLRKVYLCLVGRYQNPSTRNDIFDVTDLVKNHSETKTKETCRDNQY